MFVDAVDFIGYDILPPHGSNSHEWGGIMRENHWKGQIWLGKSLFTEYAILIFIMLGEGIVVVEKKGIVFFLIFYNRR